MDDCKRLGDLLKRMRVERGLRQVDVAARLDVNPWTLRNWEHNRTKPRVPYYPVIMDILGYCPYQRGDTFGMKIMLHRTYQGVTQRQLAQLLKVDPGSVSRWETGIRCPMEGVMMKLLGALGERFANYKQQSNAP
ncbi:MAG: helix-turn-helix transcriptional regulator [Candidatus Thiodiazotropha sp.]